MNPYVDNTVSDEAFEEIISDFPTREYPIYKIELTVDHDDLREVLELVRYHARIPAVYYQVAQE